MVIEYKVNDSFRSIKMLEEIHVFKEIFKFICKYLLEGWGDGSERLRILAAILEVWGSIFSNHMVAHNLL